ncbi:RNA polymerase sigma-70 factor [Parafilimonas sp.]|uniref:RNA polymerase sigma-70 factor n=1 Tax=Parafilimonas sp. TaxID=1969739 RepID=UPI0039E40156
METVRDYSGLTDKQLLILLKEGNENAFTAIYDRYAEKLFAIAFSFAKRKDVAEDMVQHVFMRLWDRRYSVEINSLSAYLATAIKFSVFLYLQKEFRRMALLEKMPALCVSHSGESDINVLFLKATLERAVQLLPEKCKIVYQYSRENGMPVKEIAERMHLAPKTVENHLFRALQTLRAALKNACF